MGKLAAVRAFSGIAAILGLTLFFGGCDNSPSTDSTGGASTKPTADTGASVKMANIIFGNDEFFRLIKFGVHDEAKKLNVGIVDGNSDNSQAKEAELVQQYTDQKVAAIIISPLSTTASAAALKAAHNQGIIIITNNTSLADNFAEGSVVCSSDDLGAQTGNACKTYIEQKLGGTAVVAIAAFHKQNAEQSDARAGGFRKVIAAMPNVKILEINDDTHDAGEANRIISDFINLHPEINVVYGANEGGTTGAVRAVKQANKAGKVAVFGTDVSAVLIGYLKSDDNILQAITAQKPFEIGQKAMEIALKALHKETFDKNVILNGVCLKRSDLPGVEQFEKDLKSWQSSGN